jgi:hypothetical protein
MFNGANLSFNLWPWAFNHCLLLNNMLPHGDGGVPIIRIGGKRPDVAHIRTFGFQVNVHPPGKQPSKFEPHVNEGTYLGSTAPSIKLTRKIIAPTSLRRWITSVMMRA